MMIVLVTRDLMAASKIAPATESLGASFRSVGSVSAVADVSPAPALVVLDLNSSLGDINGAVAALKALSPSPSVIAFGPHVHEAKLSAAAAAGCDAVFVRGQFHAQTAEILRRFVGRRAAE